MYVQVSYFTFTLLNISDGDFQFVIVTASAVLQTILFMLLLISGEFGHAHVSLWWVVRIVLSQ